MILPCRFLRGQREFYKNKGGGPESLWVWSPGILVLCVCLLLRWLLPALWALHEVSPSETFFSDPFLSGCKHPFVLGKRAGIWAVVLRYRRWWCGALERKVSFSVTSVQGGLAIQGSWRGCSVPCAPAWIFQVALGEGPGVKSLKSRCPSCLLPYPDLSLIQTPIHFSLSLETRLQPTVWKPLHQNQKIFLKSWGNVFNRDFWVSYSKTWWLLPPDLKRMARSRWGSPVHLIFWLFLNRFNMVEKHALYTYHLVKKELRGDVLVCAGEIKARKCFLNYLEIKDLAQ